MFKLRMYVPCITNTQSEDIGGRNCIRVPLIDLELAIDPLPIGRIWQTIISRNCIIQPQNKTC